MFLTPVFSKSADGLGADVPAPRRTAKEPLNSCSQSPRQPGSREQRGLRARAGRRGRGRGSGARPLAGPPIPGPGPRPQMHCWGRRGVAVRRAGVRPLRLPAGGLAQPGLAPLPGRPGPPSSGTPAAPSRFSTPTLGRAGVLGQSRTEPPRRVNYSWGSRACSQDLLCPQLLRRSGENAGEKLPQQSWPHFSFFQVSIEHLLDAWHLHWGCCQGLGRNVRSSWAPRVSAGNNA